MLPAAQMKPIDPGMDYSLLGKTLIYHGQEKTQPTDW